MRDGFSRPARFQVKALQGAELAAFAPDVADPVVEAVAAAKQDLGFLRLDEKAFTQAQKISIDYAVMGKTGKAAVVAGGFGWSDVGGCTGPGVTFSIGQAGQRPYMPVLREAVVASWDGICDLLHQILLILPTRALRLVRWCALTGEHYGQV